MTPKSNMELCDTVHHFESVAQIWMREPVRAANHMETSDIVKVIDVDSLLERKLII